LQSLYLSSNKLSGTIPSGILLDSFNLVNLSVSYNNLRGTIPESMLSNMLTTFDIGNNKISGTLSDERYIVNNRSTLVSNSSKLIDLNNNRFSGPIPVSSVNNYEKVSILQGNLFGCDKEIPPGKDHFESIFICGSRDLDIAIYFMCTIIFLCVVYYIVKHPKTTPYLSIRIYDFISKLNSWYNSIDDVLRESKNLNNFNSFVRCIRVLGKTIIIINITFTIVVLTLVPMLKSFSEYSTHTFQYNWQISFAFLSGLTPAILIFFLWIVFVIIAIESIYRFHSKELSSDQSIVYLEDEKKKLSFVKYCKKYIRVTSVIIINFTLLATVNFLYVYAKLNLAQNYFILSQIGLSLFKLIYLGMLGFSCMFIAIDINVSNLDKIRVRILLLLLNNIVSPLVATFFTDSNCFYKYVIPPKPIDSIYSYPFCNLPLPDSTCGEWVELSNVQSIQPPFIYSSLCTSALLINYIPLTIYLYAFMALSYPVCLIVLSHLDPSILPRWAFNVLPGIIWPSRSTEFRNLSKSDIMISSQMLHMTMVFDLYIYIYIDYITWKNDTITLHHK